MTSVVGATLVDVARRAGVSRTTASAALGAGGRVSTATRERVRAAALELGYVPNRTARHLRAGRVGAIGLYVNERLMAAPFYLEFVVGFAAAAHVHDYAVTLLTGPSASSGGAHVDGIVIVDPVPGDPAVAALLASGLPVVCAEKCLDPGAHPTVTIETDYVAAMELMLDRMFDEGARAPALLTVPQRLSVLAKLEAGYRRWCRQLNLPARVITTSSGLLDDGLPELLRDELAAPDRPDAIVAAADGLALAAFDTARHMGVPVMVASCIDGTALRLVTPGITAIEAPPREIGMDAARVLLDVLDGIVVDDHLVRATPGVVFRGSTDQQRARRA